mgnify:CR=1 FL=1|jgi:hypothetical protein
MRDTASRRRQTRNEDSIRFRVSDRAIHYEMSETGDGDKQLLAEVLLYVVTNDGWLAHCPRGNCVSQRCDN